MVMTKVPGSALPAVVLSGQNKPGAGKVLYIVLSAYCKATNDNK